MPATRQRVTAASTETRSLLPEIPRRSGTDPTSYFYPYTGPLQELPPNQPQRYKLRTAVINGDPLDVAIGWQDHSFPHNSSQNTSTFPFSAGSQTPASTSVNRAVSCGLRAPPVYFKSLLEGEPTNRILVLNTANDKKPGGEWEGGILSQEEGFARRSNLAQALTTIDPRTPHVQTYYPIPHTGAVYSPNVVVFREGFDKDYRIWGDEDWTTIAVVSASAVRRPKTDETGMTYSFEEEKNLQRDKMKTILRVAALNGHTNLVLGGFGSCGPEGSGGGQYRNPVRDVCELWYELLLQDKEFNGWFANIVFAFEGRGGSWAKEDTRIVEEFQKKFG